MQINTLNVETGTRKHNPPAETDKCAAPSQVLEVRVDFGKSLSNDLVRHINDFCDLAEDMGPNAILCISIEQSITTSESEYLGHIDLNTITKWERVLRRLERLSAITVATSNEDVLGYAFGLLVCTDYRIVAENTYFKLVPPGETLLPSMLLHRLSKQVGIALTRRMAITDKSIDSEEALRWGLVDEVCQSTDLALQCFLSSLRQRDLQHTSMLRRLILEESAASYEEALGAHLAACDRVLRKSST